MMLPSKFSDWFSSRGWSPRDHQLDVAASALKGDHTLLMAPTGGGKTLAGFLAPLIDLDLKVGAFPETGLKTRPHALHTLYISPLKALATDVARNLEAPVSEMALPFRVETRTGDTPGSRRQRQRAYPPDILMTTPEQVSLILSSEHCRVFFEDLRFIIIDEIHALEPNKRGDLLALSLAALHRYAPNATRIGLSATISDPDRLAKWLAPQNVLLDEVKEHHAHIVKAIGGAEAVVEVHDADARIPWAGHSGKHALEEIYERIKNAGITLIFVNTRSQAEVTFSELWRMNEDGLAIALHHGSLEVDQRRKVEQAMVKGELKAVVCTSTLDLGVDWGDVDLVIQMGAPKGASRLMQRIGRANHRLDASSHAVLVPTNRFEVLECRAAEDAVNAGDLDGPMPHDGALDVLAQHIMARACGDPFYEDELYEEIKAAYAYRKLSPERFKETLEFVKDGGYALKTYDKFKRIIQPKSGPHKGRWKVRNRDTATRHRLNVGTIIEAPLLDVRFIKSGKRPAPGSAGTKPLNPRFARKLGQIEEWFVEHMSQGDSFLFGGRILEYIGTEETDVLTGPSKDRQPSIPSWQGGKFPLSTFLAGRVREMIHNPEAQKNYPEQVREWINIQAEKSYIPAPDELLIETFPRADKYYLVAYPFEGRLAHQTLGMLITRRLERVGKKPMGFVASEYALSVWAMDHMGDLDMDDLFHADMLGDDLEDWLNESLMMKRTFRNCAIISGLIEQRHPGKGGEKTGKQVTVSTDLIYDVLREHEPGHILIEAARQEAAQGLMDVWRLSEALARIKGRIRHFNLEVISPFAVPVMLEIGKESIFGGDADEAVLRFSEEELISEAMGV